MMGEEQPDQVSDADAQQFLLDTSRVPSYVASVFGFTVTVTGGIRVTYGEAIDPRIPPSWSGAFTANWEAAEQFHERLGRVLELYKQQRERMTGGSGQYDAPASAPN